MHAVRNETRVRELHAIRQSSTAPAPPSTAAPMDVYILSFDSLSQMAFRRSLPKTVEFLEAKMGSIVLNGFNIVGDGTPQAFIPFLTGRTEEELPLARKR